MGEINFDLLGDPIPDGWGRRGRPEHIPSMEKRNKIIVLLAFGWKQHRIAAALSVSEPTLRKHYFRELKVGDDANLRLKAAHLDKVYQEAMGGNVAALKELGRLIDRNDAKFFPQHFADASDEDDEESAMRPRTPPLGKKEQAQINAGTAGIGSGWGTDLLPRVRPN